MAESTATPLQLTAGVGFYSGNAITANTQLANNIAAYNSLAPIANLIYTIGQAASNVSLGIGAGTLANLKTLGANVSGNYCPALGDSVPSNVSWTVGNAGYATTITTAASTYLGSGDFGKFAQAFGAAQGYISLTNNIINSAVNVNSDDYLGPTFTNMNNLISADIARVNLAFPAFGADLANIGCTIKFTRLELVGTPAGLLQNLAECGNMLNGSTPCVTAALKSEGLTDQDISDLVNNNVQSLYNQNGLTQNQFDTLQKRAYPALAKITRTTKVTGSLGTVVSRLQNALIPQGAQSNEEAPTTNCLQDVLDILDCTTLGIETMADLLNPVKLFPASFSSLTLPTPNGPVLIYDETGAVNSVIVPILNSGAVSPTGCDELAKIIPQADAAANRALQIAFQQVKGISGTTTQQLAAILQ
jgi:hypothetical protein